jgi:Lon protease-like protein
MKVSGSGDTKMDMDHDFDLRDFGAVTRLFPLPDLVMFPHVVLPLHIFEPRYLQMTEDALAGDRLITMIQIRPFPEGQTWTEPPPLEEVGCLGKILQHERLADGRFNILLLGRKRVRLRREIATGKLYRSAEVEILEDVPPTQPGEPTRTELICLFKQVFESHQKLDHDFAELLERGVSLGVLTDIFSHALALPSSLKQCLLAETSVDQRVESIRLLLRKVATADEHRRPFPPPFSPN